MHTCRSAQYSERGLRIYLSCMWLYSALQAEDEDHVQRHYAVVALSGWDC
jgi:hypothetical protein